MCLLVCLLVLYLGFCLTVSASLPSRNLVLVLQFMHNDVTVCHDGGISVSSKLPDQRAHEAHDSSLDQNGTKMISEIAF